MKRYDFPVQKVGVLLGANPGQPRFKGALLARRTMVEQGCTRHRSRGTKLLEHPVELPLHHPAESRHRRVGVVSRLLLHDGEHLTHMVGIDGLPG